LATTFWRRCRGGAVRGFRKKQNIKKKLNKQKHNIDLILIVILEVMFAYA
jgi:IS4 transposase